MSYEDFWKGYFKAELIQFYRFRFVLFPFFLFCLYLDVMAGTPVPILDHEVTLG